MPLWCHCFWAGLFWCQFSGDRITHNAFWKTLFSGLRLTFRRYHFLVASWGSLSLEMFSSILLQHAGSVRFSEISTQCGFSPTDSGLGVVPYCRWQPVSSHGNYCCNRKLTVGERGIPLHYSPVQHNIDDDDNTFSHRLNQAPISWLFSVETKQGLHNCTCVTQHETRSGLFWSNKSG